MLSDKRTDLCMVYTVKEISTMLHTSPAFIYRMISSGMLPALKLGSLRVRKQALENFLEEYEGQDLSDLDHIKPLSIPYAFFVVDSRCTDFTTQLHNRRLSNNNVR